MRNRDLVAALGSLAALGACSPPPRADVDPPTTQAVEEIPSCSTCNDATVCSTACIAPAGNVTTTCQEYNCDYGQLGQPPDPGGGNGGIACDDFSPYAACGGGTTAHPMDNGGGICYGAHFTNGAIRYNCNGFWVGMPIGEPGFFGAIDAIGVWAAESDIKVEFDAAGRYLDNTTWFNYEGDPGTASSNIIRKRSIRLSPSGNTGLHGVWGRLTDQSNGAGFPPAKFFFQTWENNGGNINGPPETSPTVTTTVSSGDAVGSTYWSKGPIYAFRAWAF